MASEFREDILQYFEQRFMHSPDLEPGKMMGHPGFKFAHNGKFFVFMFDDGIALKLPPDLYQTALTQAGVIPFQPMEGRKPMSTWIVWTCDEPSEYNEHWNWIDAARHFVASEPKNPRKKRS